MYTSFAKQNLGKQDHRAGLRHTRDTGIQWGKVSEGDGSRYRYISDDDPVTQTPDGYQVVASNRASSSVALYANGKAISQTRSSNNASTERTYFGTDLLGTVRSATTDSGSAQYYDYDVFGKPLGDNISDFAYTGKPYDPTTGMYNYGYRDYSPQTARFTTVDPIRDGSNWFVYCNNEPVNWVDAWGLSASDGSVSSVENVDWCIKKDLIYGLLDWEVNIVFSNQNGMINSPIKNDNLTSANGVYNYYKSDGTYIEKYHKGIDIAALEGTPVYAAISGKVTEIKENIDGYGNSITITNDFGVSTKYSHLQNTQHKR